MFSCAASVEFGFSSNIKREAALETMYGYVKGIML
jgi:hypothetical protein